MSRHPVLAPRLGAILLLAAVLLGAALSPGALAGQAPAPPRAPRAAPVWWHVTYYKIPFREADSVVALWKAYDAPVWEELKRTGVLADYVLLRHEMADDENLILVQKYASWAAIVDTAPAVVTRRLDPDSTKRAARAAAFRGLSPISHRDGIYIEQASLAEPRAGRQARPRSGDAPRWVISYYKVDWPKVDSLVALQRAYTAPTNTALREAGVLSDWKVLVHNFAGTENVLYVWKYPSWAAIQDTSAAAIGRRLQPDSARRAAVGDAFRGVAGSGEHRDGIYTQVLPAPRP